MDTYDLMPLSATDSCAQTSAGYVCTKALEHVGEHATHTAGGVVIKRWPNTQSTPGDAVKDAAPASSGAPNSIVELDQQQALDSLIANVLAWANGPVGHKALDGALRLAVADYERVMGL
jgi:hypothetical protein